ncbi:MAG: hypothetical protein ACJZ70_03500 [Limisphaerales bacterium]
MALGESFFNSVFLVLLAVFLAGFRLILPVDLLLLIALFGTNDKMKAPHPLMIPHKNANQPMIGSK